MIKTFKDKRLEKFFQSGKVVKGMSATNAKKLKVRLSALHAMSDVRDLSVIKGWRYHPYNDGTGRHSVNVSGNFRVIFRLEDKNVVVDVEMVDPH